MLPSQATGRTIACVTLGSQAPTAGRALAVSQGNTSSLAGVEPVFVTQDNLQLLFLLLPAPSLCSFHQALIGISNVRLSLGVGMFIVLHKACVVCVDAHVPRPELVVRYFLLLVLLGCATHALMVIVVMA